MTVVNRICKSCSRKFTQPWKPNGLQDWCPTCQTGKQHAH